MITSEYAPPKPTEVAVISSLQEAVTFFERLRPTDGDLIAFRGHADQEWEFVPSIFRQNPSVHEHESEICRELLSLYPEPFARDDTMFDRLVRMQHFGLPTRLLDVSRDPLAALYFAVEEGQEHTDAAVVVLRVPADRRKYFDSDSVSCLANLSNLSDIERDTIQNTKATTMSELHKINAVDRLYQFIRVEKPHFMPRIRKEDLFKPYYVTPKMSNNRIVAQSGAFVVFGLNWRRGPSYKRGLSATMVRVPAAAKHHLRDSLDRLGYNDSTMFPEIERASRQIVKSFQKGRIAA